MYKTKITISNKLGLHARPASLLVKEATRYSSIVKVIKNDKEYDSKSIIGILSMVAVKGDVITVLAEGPDEKEAVEGLVRLLESKFGEE